MVPALFFFFKDARVFVTHVWIDRFSKTEFQSNEEAANGHDATGRNGGELMGQNEAKIGRER